MEKQGMNKSKFVYIPNGIDLEDYNINEPLPKENGSKNKLRINLLLGILELLVKPMH